MPQFHRQSCEQCAPYRTVNGNRTAAGRISWCPHGADHTNAAHWPFQTSNQQVIIRPDIALSGLPPCGRSLVNYSDTLNNVLKAESFGQKRSISKIVWTGGSWCCTTGRDQRSIVLSKQFSSKRITNFWTSGQTLQCLRI